MREENERWLWKWGLVKKMKEGLENERRLRKMKEG